MAIFGKDRFGVTKTKGRGQVVLGAWAGALAAALKIARTRWTDPSSRVTVTALFVAAAHLPSLAFHATDLWSRSHYHFFPLVALGAAFLAHREWPSLGLVSPGNPSITLAMFGCCWCLLLSALVLNSPWLGAVAALTALGSGLFGLGGTSLFRRLRIPWAFLWLTIPLPLDYDHEMISWLQSCTAQYGSALLDLCGVLHVLVGNVIEVDGRRLMVEEACAGAHSFFAIVPLTIFFMLWTRRRVGMAWLLVSIAAVWALAANVVRIAGVTLLTTQLGIDVTHGWTHEVFGLAVYAAALGLVVSTDRLFLFFVPKRSYRSPAHGMTASKKRSARTESSDRPVRGKGTLSICGVLIIGYGLLTAAQGILLLRDLFQGDERVLSRSIHFEPLGANVLPSQWGQWKQLDYTTERRRRNSDSGEYSQIWRYQFGNRVANVSLDYAFTGWHELSHCYRTQGWTIDSRTYTADELNEVNPQTELVQVSLSRPFGPSGYLLFAVFDASGRPLRPKDAFGPQQSFAQRLMSRLAATRTRLASGGGVDSLDNGVSSFQLQLFVVSDPPLAPEEQREATGFLQYVASRLTDPTTLESMMQPSSD